MRLKFMLIHMMLLMVIMGGCFNVPDTRAFQDEFTKEFMQSTKEAEEGYYTFESGTGGYTMLFPVDATLDEGYYYKQGDVIENISFANEEGEGRLISGARISYDSRSINEYIDVQLDSLSNKIKYEGEYDIIELNDKSIYYAKKQESSSSYFLISFVKAKNGSQAIEIIYRISCLDEGNNCDINIELEEDFFQRILKSVEFVN
ncbi:hypothetical protein HXA34_17645 [Salipaludibacillus agaradhaerens]|nr:hypothetical protein [Salipaludibacillus agaradhaerens]